MTTTSSVSSSSAPSVNLGNAQDVSNLTAGGVTLSLADAVTSKVQPYLNQASAIQTEINTNQTQIAAYQNMQSLLQALQSAASNLTTESLQGTNVFMSRAADLSAVGSTAASTILSAAVADGTATGTHSVIVNQLAQAEADTSSTLALASSSPISNLAGSTFNGTITIAEAGKASPQAVTITPTMTLSQVAAAINGATTTNGVTASVVNVDASHQVLVLTGQDADSQLNFTDPNSILQAMGVVSGSSSSTMTGNPAAPPTSETTALGLTGSFTLHAGTQALPITVTAGQTLDNIRDAINAASAANNTGTGNITASVTSPDGGSHFELTLTDTKGNPLGFTDSTGGALAGLGLGSVATNQVRQAQALNLTVDGVAGITRNTNTVSDVLSGVTLNVTHADPNTTVAVNINPNANNAATAIQSFVSSYNAWESFVSANEATDSNGNAAASAVLFGDSSLREASLQVTSAITGEINNTSLGALGISLNGANQMVVNATTLDSALNNNFNTVANLFQATLTTNSVNLQPSGNNLSTFAGSFQLGITMTGSNISGLTLNGASAASDFIFAGNSIQGLYGTPYSGMYFNYTGPGETVTVNSTQGIGNQVYTAANNFGNATNGSVQNLITSKQSQNINFTSQYNNWVNEANAYANFLLTQYSSLTTQIQSAGQTLTTLTALMNADNRGA